ncbi:MAG TPA: secretin N-terminal domain-containing protein [Candidatus Aminicenantes bacterium]|nr:secretin N-terminal domain-containing protein [Candidatus Aminicenantes bacterium]
MKKTMIGLLALAFALAIAGPALAEDPAPGQQAQDRVADQRKEFDALRKEIVKLKYVRAEQIHSILRAYSGQMGMITFQDSLPSIIVVRDTPENVDKILAVIRELDVKPADVLYTVQLVLGSETDATTDAELKNDPIVKELGKLLRYKGYTLLDATLVRVINRDRASVSLGPKAEFAMALMPDVAGDAKTPVIKTEVRLRQIIRAATNVVKEGKEFPAGTTIDVRTPIESTLNIKPGDRTVVGVSKLDGGDKGLILIISGKIVE